MTKTLTDRGRRRLGLLWVIAIALLELVTVATGLGTPVQPLLSIVFVMTCPGFILLDLEKPGEFASRLVVAIGASISLHVILATVRLVDGLGWAAAVAAVAVVVAASSRWVTTRRRKRSVEPVAVTPDLDEALRFEVPIEAPAPGLDEMVPASSDKRRVRRRHSFEAVLSELLAPAGDTEDSVTEPLESDPHPEGPVWRATKPKEGSAEVVGFEGSPSPGSTEAGEPALVEMMTRADSDATPPGGAQPEGPEKEAPHETDPREDVEEAARLGPLDAAVASAGLRSPTERDDDSVGYLPPTVESVSGDSGLGDSASSNWGVGDGSVESVPPVVESVSFDSELGEPALAENLAEESAAVPSAAPHLALDVAKGEGWLPVEAPDWLPVVSADSRVDLNSAAIETLITLPGVGKHLAGRLIDFRQEQGPFLRMADVLRVQGFGPAKVAGFEAFVSFDETHEERVGARTMEEGES